MVIFDNLAFFWVPEWELGTYKYQTLSTRAICTPAHPDDDTVYAQAVGLPQPSLIADVYGSGPFLRRKGAYGFFWTGKGLKKIVQYIMA